MGYTLMNTLVDDLNAKVFFFFFLMSANKKICILVMESSSIDTSNLGKEYHIVTHQGVMHVLHMEISLILQS